MKLRRTRYWVSTTSVSTSYGEEQHTSPLRRGITSSSSSCQHAIANIHSLEVWTAPKVMSRHRTAICVRAKLMLQMYTQFEQHLALTYCQTRHQTSWKVGAVSLILAAQFCQKSSASAPRVIWGKLWPPLTKCVEHRPRSRMPCRWHRQTCDHLWNSRCNSLVIWLQCCANRAKHFKWSVDGYDRLDKLYQVSHETLYTAIGRLAEFVTTLDKLRKFEHSMMLATHGILTADIIPRSEMRLAPRKVQRAVRRRTKNLQPLNTSFNRLVHRKQFSHVARRSIGLPFSGISIVSHRQERNDHIWDCNR